MSKAAQTRQFIIEKASPLFNIKGYGNTSLSDIQEVTGLTKGAIYGNFADKNELAVAAYEYNCFVLRKKVEEAIAETSTAKAALLACTGFYTGYWPEIFKKGGCPMMNAAVEADDHLHFMRDTVRNSMKRFIKKIQQLIEKGQSNGEFKKTIVAADYAALLFSILEGNILLAKIMNDPKYLKAATKRITLIVENELST
jgi:TetR/AcrR family transcriptional repressor of nem operon